MHRFIRNSKSNKYAWAQKSRFGAHPTFKQDIDLVARSVNPKNDVQSCACGGFCPKCNLQQPLQGKFRVSAPNEKYEQEADRVANRVVASDNHDARLGERTILDISKVNQMPVSGIQRMQGVDSESDEFLAEDLYAAESEISNIDEEKEEVQAKLKNAGGAEQHTSRKLGALSPGQMLPESSRSFFERRMGADFSSVRIHNDERAAEAAESVNARAFTFGRDVVFNKGEYSPHTSMGKHLLAHELTHVLQQSNGTIKHIQRRKKKNKLPFVVRLILGLLKYVLFPFFLPQGKSTKQHTSSAYSQNTSVFLKNQRHVNQFFSDLNGIIKSMSGRTSSLSLAKYTIKAPKDYITNVSMRRFGSDYRASLKQANEACGKPLAQMCGTNSSCVNTLKWFRSRSNNFCSGSKPTMKGIASFLVDRGYTRTRHKTVVGPSIVLKEEKTDALLHLLVHEGIHRMAGKAWMARCNRPIGSPYKHSVKNVTLKELSTRTDEGATQLITLEIIKKMQAIKGRGWFKGFKPTAYSAAVKYVQGVLLKGKKNTGFLTKAYFSDRSYKKIEDIQLWQ